MESGYVQKIILKMYNNFSKTVFGNMERREAELFENILYGALYLDPRYQWTMSRAKKDLGKIFLRSVYERMKQLERKTDGNMDQPEPRVVDEEEEEDDGDQLSSILQVMKEPDDSSKECASEINNINILLDLFDNQKKIKPSEDILVYWEFLKVSQPELHSLAMVIFSIPATQVSVERAFSALKLIYSDQREPLTPDNLEDVLLVRLNHNF